MLQCHDYSKSGANNSAAIAGTSGSVPSAAWARSVSAGTDISKFLGVASDSSGNVYAAGYQTGSGTYTYGSKSVAGTNSGTNAVLVKYDSSGNALWVQSVSAGASISAFNAVAIDASGNIYATGYQSGTGTYTYDTQSVAGSSTGKNIILVKYNTIGSVQWARAGGNYSEFNGVTVDTSGNIYAVGYQSGGAACIYGSQSVSSGAGSGTNAVLLKYDTSGNALWARSVSGATDMSMFNAVAVDTTGNIYAAGYQAGTGTVTYGSQSVAGGSAAKNIVLVKYDSSGTAQWARSISAGIIESQFSSVAVDTSGNIYAAGAQSGSAALTYGSQSVAGSSANGNIVLVKYDTTGNAQWARSVSSGLNNTSFAGIATDANGNIYAAGQQIGYDSFTYGNQNSTAPISANNVLLVKYNSAGAAQWVRTTSTSIGGYSSSFNSIAVDTNSNIYAVGAQYGSGAFTYDGQSATGSNASNYNVLLVKYQ